MYEEAFIHLENALKDVSVSLKNNANLTLLHDNLQSLQPSIRRLRKKLSEKGISSTETEIKECTRLNNIVLQYKGLNKEVYSLIKKSGVPLTNITRIKSEGIPVQCENLSKLNGYILVELRNVFHISSKSSRIDLKAIREYVNSYSSDTVMFRTVSILLEHNNTGVASFTNLVKHYLVNYYSDVYHRELSVNCIAVRNRCEELTNRLFRDGKV